MSYPGSIHQREQTGRPVDADPILDLVGGELLPVVVGPDYGAEERVWYVAVVGQELLGVLGFIYSRNEPLLCFFKVHVRPLAVAVHLG